MSDVDVSRPKMVLRAGTRSSSVSTSSVVVHGKRASLRTRRRALPGCLHFTVTPTGDPLVWSVHERFVDQAAFDLHQARVQASEWGRATAGIERDYVVTTIASDL